MKLAAEDHAADVAWQIASAECAARRQDELRDHLSAQQEEQALDTAAEEVSPAIEPTPAEELAEQRGDADHPARQKRKKA